jgi:hypothetical protein
MPTSCDELLCNLRRFSEQFTRTFQIAAIVCWLLKGSGTGPFGGLSPACSAWWHHLSAIVENCAAAGVSGVDAPRSGASCIWRQAGVRSNPAIRTFYLRLRANGKHAKPALTACMRKFLVILNAMLYNKTHRQTPALISSTSPLSPLLGAAPEHGCC